MDKQEVAIRANKIEYVPIDQLTPYEKNTYRKKGDYYELDVYSKGERLVCLISNESHPFLSKIRWRFQRDPRNGYVQVVATYKKKTLLMSRFITKCEKGMVVDHKNHNTLDNRLHNLRVCTYQQNMQNKKPLSKTGYKGVVLSGGRYVAYVRECGKSKNIGSYDTATEAALAYDKEALRIQGEFARLNFG